jgi:hypothetical protein
MEERRDKETYMRERAWHIADRRISGVGISVIESLYSRI